MNNTINNFNSTVFGARYLCVKDGANKIPEKVYDAIYKSDAVDKFITAGRPRTLWGRIVDIFKKDEMLSVSYAESVVPLPQKDIPKDKLNDPYAKTCNLLFTFHKRNGAVRKLPLSAQQEGIKRQAGSVPRPGEHHMYKPPFESAEEKLVKQIEGLKDLDSLLA